MIGDKGNPYRILGLFLIFQNGKVVFLFFFFFKFLQNALDKSSTMASSLALSAQYQE